MAEQSYSSHVSSLLKKQIKFKPAQQMVNLQNNQIHNQSPNHQYPFINSLQNLAQKDKRTQSLSPTLKNSTFTQINNSQQNVDSQINQLYKMPQNMLTVILNQTSINLLQKNQFQNQNNFTPSQALMRMKQLKENKKNNANIQSCSQQEIGVCGYSKIDQQISRVTKHTKFSQLYSTTQNPLKPSFSRPLSREDSQEQRDKKLKSIEGKRSKNKAYNHEHKVSLQNYVQINSPIQTYNTQQTQQLLSQHNSQYQSKTCSPTPILLNQLKNHRNQIIDCQSYRSSSLNSSRQALNSNNQKKGLKNFVKKINNFQVQVDQTLKENHNTSNIVRVQVPGDIHKKIRLKDYLNIQMLNKNQKNDQEQYQNNNSNAISQISQNHSRLAQSSRNDNRTVEADQSSNRGYVAPSSTLNFHSLNNSSASNTQFFSLSPRNSSGFGIGPAPQQIFSNRQNQSNSLNQSSSAFSNNRQSNIINKSTERHIKALNKTSNNNQNKQKLKQSNSKVSKKQILQNFLERNYSSKITKIKSKQPTNSQSTMNDIEIFTLDQLNQQLPHSQSVEQIILNSPNQKINYNKRNQIERQQNSSCDKLDQITEDCIFKPQINKISQQIVSENRKSKQDQSKDSKFDELYCEAIERELRKEQQREKYIQEQESKLKQELTFKPVIFEYNKEQNQPIYPDSIYEKRQSSLSNSSRKSCEKKIRGLSRNSYGEQYLKKRILNNYNKQSYKINNLIQSQQSQSSNSSQQLISTQKSISCLPSKPSSPKQTTQTYNSLQFNNSSNQFEDQEINAKIQLQSNNIHKLESSSTLDIVRSLTNQLKLDSILQNNQNISTQSTERQIYNQSRFSYEPQIIAHNISQQSSQLLNRLSMESKYSQANSLNIKTNNQPQQQNHHNMIIKQKSDVYKYSNSSTESLSQMNLMNSTESDLLDFCADQFMKDTQNVVFEVLPFKRMSTNEDQNQQMMQRSLDHDEFLQMKISNNHYNLKSTNNQVIHISENNSDGYQSPTQIYTELGEECYQNKTPLVHEILQTESTNNKSYHDSSPSDNMNNKILPFRDSSNTISVQSFNNQSPNNKLEFNPYKISQVVPVFHPSHQNNNLNSYQGSDNRYQEHVLSPSAQQILQQQLQSMPTNQVLQQTATNQSSQLNQYQNQQSVPKRTSYQLNQKSLSMIIEDKGEVTQSSVFDTSTCGYAQGNCGQTMLAGQSVDNQSSFMIKNSQSSYMLNNSARQILNSSDCSKLNCKDASSIKAYRKNRSSKCITRKGFIDNEDEDYQEIL